MASVIRLARYRGVTRRDLPLDIPVGDSDLQPIAVLLWVGSVVRVVLALSHREAFGAEASVALFCALLLPLFLLSTRHSSDTAQQ